MPRTATRVENFAQLRRRLGNIPLQRIRVQPPPGRATEKDLLILLERDKRLCELVDGVLVEKVMGMKEAMLAGHLFALMHAFVRMHDLGLVAPGDGPLRLIIGAVRLPDVAFFSWNQLPTRAYPDEPIPGLFPDLAVEVVSKGNTTEEIRRKLQEYFLAGTRLVWIIYPKTRTAEVFRSLDDYVTLGEKDSLDGQDVLPGFSVPLKELFALLSAPQPRKNGKSHRKS